jgi:hypothetical protein
MSRKSLVPVNVPALASAPTIPTLRTGDLYFNTTDSTLYSYNGTAWAASGGGGGGGSSSITVSDTAPTSPGEGDLWFKSDVAQTFVYFDSYWIEIGVGPQGPAGQATIFRWKKTAVGGETTISGNDDSSVPLSYTVQKEQLYLNGTLLVRGDDYVATTGNSISGLTALAAGDITEVISFGEFILNSSVSLSTIDAKGDLLVGTLADTVSRLAVGSNGTYLQADSSTATGLKWSAVSGYSAPTLGSTSIASGATVTTIAGLTLTSPTLTGTVTVSGDINLTAAGGPGSLIDELTLILMGAI